MCTELKVRINYLSSFGELLESFFSDENQSENPKLIQVIEDAEKYNSWFSKKNIINALKYFGCITDGINSFFILMLYSCEN